MSPQSLQLQIKHRLYSPTIWIWIGPLRFSSSAETCFVLNAVAESLSVFERATFCGRSGSSSRFVVVNVGLSAVKPFEVLGSVRIVNTVVMVCSHSFASSSGPPVITDRFEPCSHIYINGILPWRPPFCPSFNDERYKIVNKLGFVGLLESYSMFNFILLLSITPIESTAM